MSRAGQWVIVTDANGAEHRVKAASGIVPGRDMPVVWTEWPTPDGADRVPWPAESVRPDETGREAGQ